MKKAYFENLVSNIFDDKINIKMLVNQQATKWYDKTYTKDFEVITNKTKYGVWIDGTHSFDFVTGANEDNYLKTFINQHISKVPQYGLVNGTVQQLNKVDKLAQIKDSNRVTYGLTYTTLYGFGIWAILINDESQSIVLKDIAEFLKSKGIEYTNEWSEAQWVFRFKFNAKIEQINSLMEEFKLKYKIS